MKMDIKLTERQKRFLLALPGSYEMITAHVYREELEQLDVSKAPDWARATMARRRQGYLLATTRICEGLKRKGLVKEYPRLSTLAGYVDASSVELTEKGREVVSQLRKRRRKAEDGL